MSINKMDKLKKNKSKEVDVCQPYERIERIEIIEKDGLKMAVEYGVSVRDFDCSGIALGVDYIDVYHVH